MKKMDIDAAKLAALPLDELEALAAPVMAALRTKRETQSKEERRIRRKEHDRLRKLRTVAVTMRFDDEESAVAVRNLVKQLRTVAMLNGRTVASVVEVAVKRLPVGRRKAATNPKKANTKNTPSKTKSSATNVKKAVIVNNGKTELPKANDIDGGNAVA